MSEVLDCRDARATAVTELLERLDERPEQLERIMELVYEDLRRVAHFQRASHGANGARTTALVHEAFVKLFGGGVPEIRSRTHLMRVCAMAVRQLIVDRARARMSLKRGGDAVHVPLEEGLVSVDRSDAEQVLMVEEALHRLEAHDGRLADLIVGNYFGGYTVEQLAEMAGCSARTIHRDLKKARGWLRLEMEHF